MLAERRPEHIAGNSPNPVLRGSRRIDSNQDRHGERVSRLNITLLGAGMSYIQHVDLSPVTGECPWYFDATFGIAQTIECTVDSKGLITATPNDKSLPSCRTVYHYRPIRRMFAFEHQFCMAAIRGPESHLRNRFDFNAAGSIVDNRELKDAKVLLGTEAGPGAGTIEHQHAPSDGVKYMT